MLTRSELYRLVNDYIEVSSGYLGDFSYRTHKEFYPYYCNLNINPYDYEGTTKERFIKILESSDAITQAKIIEGVLTKYTVSYFPENEREGKQALFNEFQEIIKRLKSSTSVRQGTEGEVKNLIFAANGPKPEIVLADSISNQIQIVKNANFCLVYNLLIPENGLTWETLVEWWAKKNNFAFPNNQTEFNLYNRLKQSLEYQPEIIVFTTYFKRLRREFGKSFPAFIPQVYLHYDQKTIKKYRENSSSNSKEWIS